MNCLPGLPLGMSRREMLRRSGLGMGGLALAYLCHQDGLLAGEAASHGTDLRSREGHFPAKARAVIQLMMNGGPSQMDLFDPKPELQKRDGQDCPLKVDKFLGENSDQLLASPFKFLQQGQSGLPFGETLPHVGSLADTWCVVRSMHTEHDNHFEASVMFNSGKPMTGRPTLGSWVSYALGTENQNLPSFVVLRDPARYDNAGSHNWSNGWLPALHRGTEFNTKGVPVPNLKPSSPVQPDARTDDLELLARLNEEHRKKFPANTELEARIRNYELAARMQLSAGDVLDISREPLSLRKLYGLDNPATASFGTRCLMARRLIEAGVRFVQIFPDQVGQQWDQHRDLKNDLQRICGTTDLPSAGLVRDLQSRGLLDSTIVLWSGEFGRLPVSQGKTGRDHNRHAFSALVAGGGFKGGMAYGQTDDFGYAAVEDRVSVPSLHATILHQMGLNHRQLTFVHEGSAESLTDERSTKARVVSKLIHQSPQVSPRDYV